MFQLIAHNFFSFVLIISVIVFIHEFGHFWVARLCKVRVEAFSIGFGYELFGFTDKKQTRWKFCLLPFGGYVKMFGDRNAASMPDNDAVKEMSEEEKKASFVGKSVYQRMAIVAAGPIFNIVLTIFLLATLFRINGLNIVEPVVDEVIENSAAFSAGVKSGDRILEIDGKKIDSFDQIRAATIELGKDELSLKIQRDSKVLNIEITPTLEKHKNVFGDDVEARTLGITSSAITHTDLNIFQSLIEGTKETANLTVATFKALGELITGKRDLKELSGPVKIAQYSGKSVSGGFILVIWFAAMISLNLGILNLLPVPVLDGGHLFFYIIEAIRGKALPQQTQQIAFQLGAALVFTLMIFTTLNDIRQLF